MSQSDRRTKPSRPRFKLANDPNETEVYISDNEPQTKKARYNVDELDTTETYISDDEPVSVPIFQTKITTRTTTTTKKEKLCCQCESPITKDDGGYCIVCRERLNLKNRRVVAKLKTSSVKLVIYEYS